MSTKHFQDDDEYQEEDEESYEDVEEWEGESESDEEEPMFPQFLEGDFKLDDTRTIRYKKDGSFCLVSQNDLPSSWSLHSPVLQSLKFGGWIQNPMQWLDFDVQISEQETVDPMDEKIIKAQQQQESETQHLDIRSKASMKDDDEDEKSTAVSLKAPPTYSLKAPPSYSLKQPMADDSKKQASISTSTTSKVAYTMVGRQLDSGTDQTIKFRGIFYPPDQKAEKLFLISSITIDEGDSQTMASQAAASAKKRNREGDDDSVDSNNEVVQELIDLHHEAGLSTDELMRRYYMTSQDDLDYKQPTIAKRSKQIN